MHRILVAGFIAATSLAPVAWSHPARADEAPTQTLKIALREDADALDPSLARSYVGRIVFASLCDKLFDINDKLEVVPQLALGYEWLEPTVLRIDLRPNVKFQDGTQMDAEAVKYSLMRHLTMQGSARRGEISTLDHVEVVDPLTVKLFLKAPTSPLIAQLTDRAGMIVSPKAAEAAGKDFALHPVCAGPFKFVERVAQDRIVLERFPDYWDAANIHFARVIFQPIVDSTTRLANLRSGAMDMLETVIPSDVAAVQADKKLRLMMSPGLGYQAIYFNLNHGPKAVGPIAKDARVRRAFELSIDRDALTQVVFNGMFPTVAQAVAPSSPFYAKAVLPKPRDIAAAKKLLAEAEVSLPVKFSVNVANSPNLIQAMEVIQAMAAEAGFEMKINTMEFATSLDAADRGEFEGYMGAWSGRTDPDGNLWNFIHTGGPLNYPGYSSPEIDRWLEAARATTDQAKRSGYYAKVAAQNEVDLPIMYLFAPSNIVGMSTKINGFTPVPDGLIRLQGVTKAP